MFPNGGKFLFRERFPFLVIVRRVDAQMVRVLLITKVMGIGIIPHLLKQVLDVLLCCVFFLAVVDDVLKVFRAEGTERFIMQRFRLVIG